MATYTMNWDGKVLRVGFNPAKPADNDKIVVDAAAAAEALKDKVMGSLLLINGPASLPVAMTISHAFAHLVPAIAGWDPKLKAYVVAITHSPAYRLGQIIQPAD